MGGVFRAPTVTPKRTVSRVVWCVTAAFVPFTDELLHFALWHAAATLLVASYQPREAQSLAGVLARGLQLLCTTRVEYE